MLETRHGMEQILVNEAHFGNRKTFLFCDTRAVGMCDL